MPQDSTNILYQTGDTFHVATQDSVHQAIATLPSHNITLQADDNGIQLPEAAGWLIFMAIVFSIIMILYWLPVFWHRVLVMVRDRGLYRQATNLYWQGHSKYNDILAQYIPYYRQLSAEHKEMFLHRTLTFMAAKKFRFIDIEGEERIPLLISATAVQLTFGLQHFLLDYFNTIYVLPNRYRYGESEMAFQGHVSEEGIFFSWENFLAAFANYNDGDNVGLHEMAHALAYVNFMTDGDGSDAGFRERFREFSQTGRKIFEEMQLKTNHFLGSYAATNYNEFWAVSVERFFEQPRVFRALLPELYLAMCRLLNQDPLSEILFLRPLEEA